MKTNEETPIEWLGQKRILLDSITFPAGFAARKKADHVKDRAASIMRTGGRPINAPTVRQLPGKRLVITGRDRLAAMFVNGETHALVELVRCTDDQAKKIELDENLERRRGDDYDAMLAERVALEEKAIRAQEVADRIEADNLAEERAAKGEKPTKATKAKGGKKGRPETAKGKAREIVAKQTGKSVEAIRQAEKRVTGKVKAKKRTAEEQRKSDPAELTKSPWPGVETWGLAIDDTMRDKEGPAMLAASKALDDASRHLNAALRALVPLEKAPTKLERATYVRVYSAVQEAHSTARRAALDAVCPTCKWIPGRRKDCTGCGETGWVSKDAIDNAAEPLTRRGADAVVPDFAGGFMSLADASKGASKKPIPTGKPTLTIEVEGANGETSVFGG